MKRFAIISFLFATTLLYGQSSNISTLFLSSFEKAERMYQHLAYNNALELYLYSLERNPENHVARQRIADCYFRLGNIEEAERRYGELASLEMGDPINKYKYAQVLSIQGKYGDAEKWFIAYANAQKDDLRADNKLSFIYSISYYFRDSLLYTISNEKYNSDQSDFGPHLYKDKVVFVSARDRDLFVKRKSLSAIDDNESHLNVYSAPATDARGDEDVVPFYNEGLNSVLHDGPITFFANEKKIAFTRNNTRNGKPYTSKNGRVNLKIYFGELDDSNQLRKLTEFPFNNDDFSAGHPWVSEDGKQLYFASDMPGGIGGVDLYKSEFVKGEWTKPVNLGQRVNTMGDEFYPFIAFDSVLYYSSNGLGGLGGLDIFVSYLDKTGEFSAPMNLGFPLNTSSDDFSLIINKTGRGGLFASNRPGGLGYDDIYKFEVKSFFLTGQVIDRMDSAVHIPNAKIDLLNADGNVLASATSDQNGIVHFDLDFDNNYQLTASKKDYSWVDSLSYSTQTRFMGSDSVLIPLWKHSLFAKGVVYSNEKQSILPDATVHIENLSDRTSASVIVDSTGTYTFEIVPNKRYTISASKEGHLSTSFALNTSDIFHGELINDFLLEEIFIDKAVVQFEFDKYDLGAESISQLKPLLKSLQRRKETTLNIGAHADAYGSSQYNKALSEKRAMAVLQYFVNNGIQRARIVAVGFGEKLPLNRCSDGTECTEDEHSRNRRAEIKVQVPE